LPAAGRIENRAVEPNAALIGGNHPRSAGSQIPIVAKQQLVHHLAPLSTIPAKAGIPSRNGRYASGKVS
jgi:hypothetical protein